MLALLATVLITVSGLVAGGIGFGWHAVDLSLVGFSQGTAEWIGNLGIATLYVFWSLSSVIAFGFMVSTMTDSPVGATFAAFGFYVFSQILDGITAIGSIRYVVPHPLLRRVGQPLHAAGRELRHGAGGAVPIAYVLVFCGIGYWWFRRKDVLS